MHTYVTGARETHTPILNTETMQQHSQQTEDESPDDEFAHALDDAERY